MLVYDPCECHRVIPTRLGRDFGSSALVFGVFVVTSPLEVIEGDTGACLPWLLSPILRRGFKNAFLPWSKVGGGRGRRKTFIVISKGKDIFRFSGEDAVWALSPFSPVRRVAIHILVHPLFSLIIITTILLNCFMMIMPSSAKIESSEVIFTAIYTFESATKVMGRGFILEPFTYLRDAWNWLDFIVITLAYITMGIDLGNLAALRTFRVLRALKTVAIIPGLKTIVGAVIESVKNLRDVIILTVFALSVFALLGLQIYMGVLTQKCIQNFPEELIEKYLYQSNTSMDQFHEAWAQFNENSSNWFWLEGAAHPVLCGNATGAGTCPDNYTCYQGFGRNPNYGYTSFDTFAWSFLSAFRLMTQDVWEDLYQSVLRTAGSWHIIFFLVIIFLGSFYLVNLILAIVAMSYDELQKKAEEEEEAALAEEEALRHPPDPGETKDQLSVFSEEPDDDNISDSDYEANNGRTNSRLRHRRASYSLPNSPFIGHSHLHGHTYMNAGPYPLPPPSTASCRRKNMCSRHSSSSCSKASSPHQMSWRSSCGPGTRKPPPLSDAALSSYFEISLPYVDDSDALTESTSEVSLPQYWRPPKGGTGAGGGPPAGSLSRKNSYCSHGSRWSYSSHALDHPPNHNQHHHPPSHPHPPPPPHHSHHVLHDPLSAASSYRHIYRSASRSGWCTADVEDEDEDDRLGGERPYPPTSDDNLNTSSYPPDYLEVEGRTTSDTVANGHLDDDHEDDHEDDLLSNGGFKSKLGLSPSIGEASYTSQRSFRKPSNHSNPFLDPSQRQSVVDMKDVMVLNDIINQAASRGGSQDTRRTSRKISMFLTSDVEDEGPNFKERLVAAAYKFIDIFCVWDCCNAYIRLAEFLSFIIFDPFIDLFITLCILVNTLFMALDQHDMDPSLNETLKQGNYFFTATFAIEAVIKLLAMSPKYYFQEGWNIFDFIIVALSLIELGLASISGLSVLRSFRLLRVFKLAKSWPTLNLLISIMGKTVGALGNLTLVLGIIIFIFAVMGMQLFGKSYEDNIDRFRTKEMPRWNFVDFMHSFMIVFRVLCGEWIESMWDCMWVASKVCVPFFLATVVIGNLVVLNLFLALLLSSFGASNLSSAGAVDDDTNKLSEAFNRMGRFRRWVTRGILRGLVYVRDKIIQCCRNQINSRRSDVGNEDWRTALHNHKRSVSTRNGGFMAPSHDFELIPFDELSLSSYGSHKNRTFNVGSHKGSLHSFNGAMENGLMTKSAAPVRSVMIDDEHIETKSISDMDDPADAQARIEAEILEATTQELMMQEYPAECCPDKCYIRFPFLAGDHDSPFWQGWGALRIKTFRLIENKYFETAVITMILVSSLALALEDVHLKNRPVLQDVLYYMDRIFTVIFFLEMCVKWLALGFVKYFTNAWCWLDFVIVMVSLINFTASLLGAGGIQAFKTMRTLRALRPLRAMSRMQGMRVVVNALVQAIPSIFNVLMVCLIFWLIFAIMGVQMFAGKYYKCIDLLTGLRVSAEIVPNSEACLSENNTAWVNSRITFDHVGHAYIALFQVATFKGWIPIMNDAIDSRDKEAGSINASRHKILHHLVVFDFRIYLFFFSLKFTFERLLNTYQKVLGRLFYSFRGSEPIYYLISILLFVTTFCPRQCLDSHGNVMNANVIPDREACLAREDLIWANSKINFDNVPNGYLALFQVATFKGWMTILYDAVDSRELGQQPIREVNIYMYLYFVFFIILGSFFTLNLFIGKKYYAAMKKMGNKKPVKAIPRPRWKPQAIVFGIVTNKKFDMIIMLFIALNMLTMTLDHYGQSEMWSFALDNLNMGFIVIFTSECVLKIFALRQYYFKEPWNVFDFVVVILSILGIVLSDLIEKYFVSPTLLRVVRVAKIGRVLRLVKGARGIRTLLFALAMSIPALFNICLLLFLVMFIFAIFGMSFFMNVKQRGTLDSVYNFETFGQSMILLFQMSTSAGWDGVLNGLMNEEDCQKDNPETGVAGNCGNSGMAIGFLLCYLVISFLIIINMYIAVILENYSQATEDVQEGLTGDDYDMYYEIWQQFDPDGTQYLKYNALSDFLDVLEPPLQIHKPNKYKIISMDIPICKGDLCYCVDVLDALTKDFFARKGNPVEETAELGEVTAHTDRPGYEPISSTLWRQREDYCARLIQHAWKRRGAPEEEDESPFNYNPRDDTEESDESEEDEAIPPHIPPERRPLTSNSTRRRNNTSRLSQPSVEAVDVVVHSRSSSVSSTTTTGGNRLFDV
eukprot:TCALIF_05863-PA protein Name:"Similar to para Sodium channel protein para (Drosophila melanogaster)" AED:0.15 eAED:0.18 QI:29/0.48/0.42/0.88/0.68/0.76/26/1108/2230